MLCCNSHHFSTRIEYKNLFSGSAGYNSGLRPLHIVIYLDRSVCRYSAFDAGVRFMQFYRMPDECSHDLVDFRFEPHYVKIDNGHGVELPMHDVDEGPKNAPIILSAHGQPVWSYSFRKMIPPLVAAGYRVIAPDIVGFGRSDKPCNPLDRTFAARVKWMHDFVRRLSLTDINLVCQDWGGPNTLNVFSADTCR